jgi:hypothetical protein
MSVAPEPFNPPLQYHLCKASLMKKNYRKQPRISYLIRKV